MNNMTIGYFLILSNIGLYLEEISSNDTFKRKMGDC